MHDNFGMEKDMNKKLFILKCSCVILWLLLAKDAFSWNDDVTHMYLSRYAVENSVLNKNAYLSKFGFERGLEEFLTRGNHRKEIKEWIAEGGELEDSGSYWDLVTKKHRSFNHFHNPLKPWESAGLDDWIPIPPYHTTGESSLLWAQDGKRQALAPEGDRTWKKAREYFFSALTGGDFAGKTVAIDKKGRNEQFARMFVCLGHQMHLIQDKAVPDHVRNDAHPEDSAYSELKINIFLESWTAASKKFINNLASKPVIPTLSLDTVAYSLDEAYSSRKLAPSAIFADTDQYNRNSPEQFFSRNLANSLDIGMAEYTNANFFSDDTKFAAELYPQDHPHYFPYPKVSDTDMRDYIAGTKPIETVTAADGTQVEGVWISKNKNGNPAHGESIPHFVRPSSLTKKVYDLFGEGALFYKTFIRDEICHKDYVEKLIPRAVGYSAGLLNYFFRGDIRLGYETTGTPGYVITNYTGERLEGRFTLYYDGTDDTRLPLWAGNGVLEATSGDKTSTFDFIPPDDAKEPSKYILVFKGKMGNEEGAVAGYVFNRTFEITPPEKFFYAMMAAGSALPRFTEVKAKVRNTSGEAIGAGTLQAVVKYKLKTEDSEFSYAVSAPVTVTSITETEAAFDFSASPIPVVATDLHLQIVFRGKIGSDNDALALGLKDISEPTPIDLFNNMDRTCIEGSWFTAGTPEANDQVDTNGNEVAEEWDVYAHDVKDIYIKITSPSTPQNASPNDFDYYVPYLEAGHFYRALYILTDYNFSYSFHTSWVSRNAEPWYHADRVFLHSGNAVKDQTDFTTDCDPGPYCYKEYSPSYYTYRGTEMWWGGGMIFVNQPYPEESSCTD
jgi:hypothetical protein